MIIILLLLLLLIIIVIKLMYLPTNMGGKGLKKIETLYKLTIKVANYIVRNQDSRIQLVRKLEEKKTANKLKSVMKDAQKYAEELNIKCQFEQTSTTMTYENNTTELQKPAPKLLTAFPANAVVNNLKKEVGNQNWLGALTLLQYSDNDITPDSTAVHYKWRNIPDIL